LGHPEGGVTEERDLTVGLGPDGQRTQHAPCRLPQALHKPRRCPAGGSSCHVRKVEDGFEEERVVHRAPLDVRAVREDLLGELPAQPSLEAEPSVRPRPSEGETAHHEGHQVREIVVSKEVGLEIVRESRELR